MKSSVYRIDFDRRLRNFWAIEEDVVSEIDTFLITGGTGSDLVDQINTFSRSNESNRLSAFRFLANPISKPLLQLVEDYRTCAVPVAAAVAQHSDPDLLRMVIARGADPELCMRDMPCALVSAAKPRLVDVRNMPFPVTQQRDRARGAVGMLGILLDAGVDPNSTDSSGKTALMSAAGSANRASVELLLERGAEVWRQDRDGLTALHRAVSASPSDSDGPGGLTDLVGTVDVLLAAGANPMQRDFSGNTAIHVMAERGHDLTREVFDEVLQRLIHAGGHLEAKNSERLTPLLLAAQNNRGASVLVPGFIEAGSDITATTPYGTGITRMGNPMTKRIIKATLMSQKIGKAFEEGADPASEEGRDDLEAPPLKLDSFGVL